MKTIKALADELGVSKTTIRRYIERIEAPCTETRSGVVFITTEGENLIKARFYRNRSAASQTEHVAEGSTHGAEHVSESSAIIAMLQKELDIKNSQITELQNALRLTTESLHAAQVLHAGSMQQQQLIEVSAPDSSEETKKPSFFDFLRRRK